MQEQTWLKYGAIALAAVGFLAIIGLAATSDESLEGETWIASELNTGSGLSEPLPGTVLTARFDDGSVTGSAGCNSYFAGYVLDGDSIEIGAIGATRAFCGDPDGVMDQEFNYLAVLEAVDRYERDEDRLTLYRGDTVLAIYHAARQELYEQ
jgi:heat shock protein HslJ